MYILGTPPPAGVLASIVLAARTSTAGTVVVAALTILFCGLVWFGSRSSVIERFGTRDEPDSTEDSPSTDSGSGSAGTPAKPGGGAAKRARR